MYNISTRDAVVRTFVTQFPDISLTILTRVERLPFLRNIPVLLTHSHPLAAPNMPNRLIKAVMPSLTALLASESDVRHQNESTGMGGSRKKGKKRARGYEGDELFRIAREVICPSEEDGEEVIAAVEGNLGFLTPHSSKG
jgi:hypothetical protein